MHRTSTDRAYLASGALTLDADGIPVDIGAMQARLAALEYTSGWRALAADGPAVASSNTGNITIIRDRNRVRLRINDVTLADPSAGLSLILTSIPLGFRPTKGRLFFLVGESGSSTSPHVALVNATWHLYIRRPAGHPWPPPTAGIDGELSWDTDQPLPTTLPGAPA